MQNAPSFSEELQGIREELRSQAVQLNYAKQYQSLLEDLRQLKASVEQKWLYFRITVALGSFVFTAAGVILGWIGFHSLEDAKIHLATKIDNHVKDASEFYGDVMASSIFYTQGRYGDAIPKLLKWFHNGHTYDKNVLIPLLVSLNVTDDWEEAKPVMQRLRAEPDKFEKINDVSVYMIMGCMEVQIGITELISGARDEAANEMDAGNKLLERTYQTLEPSQNGYRQRILMNRWFYHLAKREFKESQELVKALKQLPADNKVFNWEDIKKFRCMMALDQRSPSDILYTAAKQWSELADRYQPVGYARP